MGQPAPVVQPPGTIRDGFLARRTGPLAIAAVQHRERSRGAAQPLVSRRSGRPHLVQQFFVLRPGQQIQGGAVPLERSLVIAFAFPDQAVPVQGPRLLRRVAQRSRQPGRRRQGFMCALDIGRRRPGARIEPGQPGLALQHARSQHQRIQARPLRGGPRFPGPFEGHHGIVQAVENQVGSEILGPQAKFLPAQAGELPGRVAQRIHLGSPGARVLAVRRFDADGEHPVGSQQGCGVAVPGAELHQFQPDLRTIDRPSRFDLDHQLSRLVSRPDVEKHRPNAAARHAGRPQQGVVRVQHADAELGLRQVHANDERRVRVLVHHVLGGAFRRGQRVRVAGRARHQEREQQEQRKGAGTESVFRHST